MGSVGSVNQFRVPGARENSSVIGDARMPLEVAQVSLVIYCCRLETWDQVLRLGGDGEWQ
jgi:hypothetical protein